MQHPTQVSHLSQVPDPSSLRIHLLGSFRVVVDGAAVAEQNWRRKKSKLLIKLLALQPRFRFHREQLIELLWPDQDPALTVKNLHRMIYDARRTLEPELTFGAHSRFLAVQGSMALLQSPGELWIDAKAFEQQAEAALKDAEVESCEAALALYEGDLLPEDIYEDWTTIHRERLRVLHRDLLTRLALLYEREGQFQRSIERLKALVAGELGNEEAHRRLMRLYALTGNRHQAAQQYRQCGDVVRREIGAEPEPATIELYQQIIAGEIQPLSLAEEDHSVSPANPDGDGATERDAAATDAARPILLPLTSSTETNSPPRFLAKPDWSLEQMADQPIGQETQLEPPEDMASSETAATEQVGETALGHISKDIASPPTAGKAARRLQSRIRAFTLLGILIALIVLGAGIASLLTSAGRAKPIDSLAVLPLISERADAKMEYLSDGIAEGVINNLSALPQLRVKAWSSVSRYKGREMDALAVGRELGVRAVLTGKIVPQDDHLIFKMELVDVAEGRRLWGRQYNWKLADLTAAQAEISEAVSERLRLSLTTAERQRLVRHHTENPEAYQLYLKGRYHHRCNPEGVRKAIEYFEAAIEKDPNYALAYAGMADAYVYQAHNAVSRWQLVAKAKAAAGRALELDDTLAEAHASSGFIKMCYEWDLPGAELEFRKAIELDPNYLFARIRYTFSLQERGRLDEAVAEIRRAQELDPTLINLKVRLGDLLRRMRQYDQALQQYRDVLERDPNLGCAHAVLAEIYQAQGKNEEALAEIDRALASPCEDGDVWLPIFGAVYAKAGQKAKAREILTKLERRSKKEYVPALSKAIIYSALDEHDEAIRLYEQAYQERDSDLLDLRHDPDHPIHSDPRYAELRRRLDLYRTGGQYSGN